MTVRVTDETPDGFFCVATFPGGAKCAAAAGTYRKNVRVAMDDITEAIELIYDHAEAWQRLGPPPATVFLIEERLQSNNAHS